MDKPRCIARKAVGERSPASHTMVAEACAETYYLPKVFRMADERHFPKIKSLNSWKEISLYLDRGIRTVQRWETELALPVYRLGQGPRSPVHAFPAELEAWQLRVGKKRSDSSPINGDAGILTHLDGSVVNSRLLIDRSCSLVKQMVQSVHVQQQRAQVLKETTENLHRQMQELCSDHDRGRRQSRRALRTRGKVKGRRTSNKSRHGTF